MPTVSDQAWRATDRDRTRRLRDRSVRQPLPGAAARPRGTVRRGIRPDTGRAVVRCLRGRRLHPAALGAARLDDRRARPPAGRGLGAPDAGPWRAGRGRLRLRVREPRRADRRHAQPPARPDLRLPDDPADPRARNRQRALASRANRRVPVVRPQPPGSSATADGSSRTAAAGSPRSRSSHAGRTRSTSRRSGTSVGSTSWTAARWTVSRACC